jgi:CheY-like chemotaxis protein
MYAMPDLNVLVVDDEPAVRQVLAAAIGKAGYAVESAASASEALARLDKTPFDVVLSDVFMPVTDGIELLKQARARGHAATFIMVTAFASVDSAIDAIKAGAWDYITKPVRNEEILHRLEQIEAMQGLREENRALRTLVMGGPQPAFQFASPAMQAIDRLVSRVAPTDSTVLITGESGTGKGVSARRIHELSSRRDGPFIAVNCGAIPENLIESELFGHTKGAFTSADRPRRGLFTQADRGTIFLDEIGELPLSMQTKLLHVLEAKEVRPLGSEQSRKVDVRIIAASGPLRSSLVCVACDGHGRRSTAVPAFSGPRSRAASAGRHRGRINTGVPCPRQGNREWGLRPRAPPPPCRHPRWPALTKASVVVGQGVRVCDRRPHSRLPWRWQAEAGVDEVMRGESRWSPASEGRRAHTRTACPRADRSGRLLNVAQGPRPAWPRSARRAPRRRTRRNHEARSRCRLVGTGRAAASGAGCRHLAWRGSVPPALRRMPWR